MRSADKFITRLNRWYPGNKGIAVLLLSAIALNWASLPAYTVTPSPRLLQQGSTVQFNGDSLPVAWSQWQGGGDQNTVQTGISDLGFMQLFGVNLLDTENSSQQPIQWFSSIESQSLIVSTQYRSPYRYLNLAPLAKIANWKIEPDGTTLKITTSPAQIQSLEIELLSFPMLIPNSNNFFNFSPQRLIIQLNQPTIWQQPTPVIQPRSTSTPVAPKLTDDPTATPSPTPSPSPTPTPQPSPVLQDWVISLNANLTPNLERQIFHNFNRDFPFVKLNSVGAKTNIKVSLPPGWRPVVTTETNPNRLIVDLKPDFLTPKNIVWMPGVRWRQSYIEIPETSSLLPSLLERFKLIPPPNKTVQFPVYWLEVDLNKTGIKLQPILSNINSRQGIAPLLETARINQAPMAINAGFFNRNNRLPLGAIRLNNNWLSSPILNRGAIAWNQQNSIVMTRLMLKETIITPSGQSLPLQLLNSAYVEAGISRYNSDWGESYTSINDNELVIVVENQQVIRHLKTQKAGTNPIAIPRNGYLLVLRGKLELAEALSVGTRLNLDSQTQPSTYQNYPQMLGAGPLLIQQSQIVLDAAGERFNPAFQEQKAIRSVIGKTANDTLLIAAVHNRPNGSGPSLAELARILQTLGATDALNLDGGSSTSLYLGGYILDRPPQTVAPVHNGLGIFIEN